MYRHKWDIRQCPYCMIVCIKQVLRKNAADTVLLVMLQTFCTKELGTQKSVCCSYSLISILGGFLSEQMKLCVIQWMYMDVHFKLVSKEQSSTVLMNPIMQSVKGHENSLPVKCSPLTCSVYRNISSPKNGLGAYYRYICTKNKLLKLEAHYHH